MSEEEILTCEDCGKSDATVKEVNCPFAQEIYGKTIDCVLCEDCRRDRYMAI